MPRCIFRVGQRVVLRLVSKCVRLSDPLSSWSLLIDRQYRRERPSEVVGAKRKTAAYEKTLVQKRAGLEVDRFDCQLSRFI